MARRRLPLLPSGTASNESLHRELNDAFRTIQNLHQATLDLKLVVLTMAKQLAHHNATNFPTTRQLDSRTVLYRCAVSAWWTDSSWAEYCSALKDHASARSSKATLSMRAARSGQRAAVAEVLKKRPAARVTRSNKRTPFTLLREGSLRRPGVKPSVFKQVLKKPARR